MRLTSVICLLLNLNGFSQDVRNPQRIYFISDVQAPLPFERIVLKAYTNEEARDILFANILRQHPGNLLILGDLTSRGSVKKTWRPLDEFMNSLKIIGTKVYAIPGNHEYMSRFSGGAGKELPITKRMIKINLFIYFLFIHQN